MRYSDELIEEISSRNDIVDVIGSYIRLQKKGSNYFGLCPFHNEKSASFSVSPSKQMYYCFGCGKGGNVITFVMEYENESFTEAMEELAKRAGVELPKDQEEDEASRRKADYASVLLTVQKEAALYFYHQLKSENGRTGYQYFKNRGLTDDTIRAFGLGFANPYPNDLYQYLKKKGFSDSVLRDSGLVRIDEKGAYDKFWNRVMFPIMNINNKVIGFGGRVMGDGSPKYLNSPETQIFDKSRNLYGMNTAKRTRKPYILVCEGYMDVIALHQAGFTNAVAALGTAFTQQHGMLIKRYTKEVVLTFDSDGAGIKAALRAIPLAKEAGLNVRVLNMKPYKDPDEFIKNLGAQEYQKRIDEAENSFAFELKVLKQDYDLKDPAKYTEFQVEVCKKLCSFEDALERNNYIAAAAEISGTDYTLLKNKTEEMLIQSSGIALQEKPEKRRIQKREKDDGIKAAQRLLLTWLSENIGNYGRVKDIIEEEDFTDEMYREVYSLLVKQIEAGRVNPGDILNHFIDNKDDYNEIARIFHAQIDSDASSSEVKRGIRECIIRVKKYSLEMKAAQISDIKCLQEILNKQKELESLNISLN